MAVSFTVEHRDGSARAGLLATPHGPVPTPVFMPVGTQATVKGLTPERAVEIQQNLGSDIAMVLDECPPGNADPQVVRNAVRRSVAWAERCRKHHTRPDQ